MPASKTLLRRAGCAVLLLCLAMPATAQVEDQLSAYTGDNGTGYLQPLADAIGAGLNDGFFRSAYIPADGVHVSFELRAMGIFFGDDEKVFDAVPEGGFVPLGGEDSFEAPTIVGAGDAVIIEGESGSMFAFPGGFDLGSLSLAVPQLRVSSVKGTEAILRYIAFETGDAELGDISLFGIGARHSISQYMREDFPMDLALGFLYQSFSMGENESGDPLIDSSAFTIGLQASKRFPAGFAVIEPYAGLSIDSFKMDVEYESDALDDPTDITLDFERSTNAHLTFGIALNLHILNLHADYSIAGQNSLSIGLAVGNLMY